MLKAWYIYNGSGDVSDKNSYTLANTGAPSCRAGRKLCALKALYEPLNPTRPMIISSNLQVYISQGITNGGPQPPAPNKAYVYFLP